MCVVDICGQLRDVVHIANKGGTDAYGDRWCDVVVVAVVDIDVPPMVVQVQNLFAFQT